MMSLIMVAWVLVASALMAFTVISAVRGRWRQSGRTLIALGGMLALYAGALIAVSVTTPERDLAIGEWKCFDEWCVSLTSLTRHGDEREVMLAVQNRGRREHAPDTPHVWLVSEGRRSEVDVPGLTSRVAGGSTRQLPVVTLNVPAAHSSRLLVTEGGFPSVLVIGDDNSPFHPQPSWPLR